MKWNFLVKFTFKFYIFGLTSWSCGSWNRISSFVFQLKGLVVRSIAPENQVYFIRFFFAVYFSVLSVFHRKNEKKKGRARVNLTDACVQMFREMFSMQSNFSRKSIKTTLKLRKGARKKMWKNVKLRCLVGGQSSPYSMLLAWREFVTSVVNQR